MCGSCSVKLGAIRPLIDFLVSILQVLIPSKCPISTDKPKVVSAADPPPAPTNQETESLLRLDSLIKVCLCFLFFLTQVSWIKSFTLSNFRSSSVDAPPVETIVSTQEDVDVKETAADVTEEEKVEESPSPAVARPPHTSPDLSFASEVTP